MNLKQIICKSKRRQLLFILIFTIMIIICIYFILCLNIDNKIKDSIYIAMILSVLSVIYFLKRLFNFNSLIEYYGKDKLNTKELINMYNSPFIYSSSNNAFCDHIFMTHNAIFLINNTLKTIPILDIQTITFEQKKEIINPTTFNISKWQNTFLMTSGRGLPNTAYCIYELTIIANDKCIKGKLIKQIGEEVMEELSKTNIKYKLYVIDNFDDKLEIEKGQSKFKKDIIPGIIFLIFIIIIMFFTYIMSNF